MAVRWFSMSTQFLTDPKIEDLGEKHGPGGPLVIVALLGRAKITDSAGRVTCSYRTLGNEAFVDRGTAKAIVADAVEAGLITVEKESESEASVRFPAWVRWQDAGRKAKEREAAKPTSQANVQTRPKVSGLVPTDKTDKTDKTDREEKEKASGKPSDFDLWLAHYRETTGKTSVTGSKPALAAFKARRAEGRTLEDLKLATVGCHGDEFCRTNGHNVPETILRASKVTRYIELGRTTVPPGKSKYANATKRVAA